MLVASALSGLSGAMCQFALQGSEKLPAMMTLEMAITGVPMVLLAERVAAGDEFRMSAVYESWTAWALVPVLSSAIGGILVGEITKRLGSIAKGFAVTCGLVLTGVFQSVFAGAARSAEIWDVCVANMIRVAARAGVRRVVPTRATSRAARWMGGRRS